MAQLLCPNCDKPLAMTGFGRCSLCGEIIVDRKPPTTDTSGLATLRVLGVVFALAILAIGILGFVLRTNPIGSTACIFLGSLLAERILRRMGRA